MPELIAALYENQQVVRFMHLDKSMHQDHPPRLRTPRVIPPEMIAVESQFAPIESSITVDEWRWTGRYTTMKVDLEWWLVYFGTTPKASLCDHCNQIALVVVQYEKVLS